MHELSVCRNILSTVLNYHKQHHSNSPIKSIQLQIGVLSHLDIPSLRFNFSVIARNTAAENAILDINLVEAKAKCQRCKTVFNLEQYYESCPNCQKHDKVIVQGEDMMITSMEIQ